MTPARERARTPALAPAPWRRTLAWLMTSLCAWACICAALSRPAKAHDFRPAVLAIKQVEPGRYVTRWSPPRLSPGQAAVSPRFPDPCEIDGARLSCGPSGLTAPITFEGLAGTNIEVVVMFAGLDGETQTRVVTGDAPQVQFTPGHDEGEGSVARQYAPLGFEHILEGLDHLLFVTGLIFVVGFRRRLIWTITAFTLAHSVTLAASILGWVTLAPGPVELVIALSIVLVAREALDDRPTLTRRYPWLVAFVFGLVHGFGFSGALAEIGLPRDEIAVPLLTFNLGVEAGQLLVVGILLALSWPARRLATRAPWTRTALIGLMGTTAAYWSIERFMALLG